MNFEYIYIDRDYYTNVKNHRILKAFVEKISFNITKKTADNTNVAKNSGLPE